MDSNIKDNHQVFPTELESREVEDTTRSKNTNQPQPISRSSTNISRKVVNSNSELNTSTNVVDNAQEEEDILASVFGAIKLPPVHYNQDPEGAIEQIDDVLAKEGTGCHNDKSSITDESFNSSDTLCRSRSDEQNCSDHISSASEPIKEHHDSHYTSQFHSPDFEKDWSGRIRSMTVDSSVSYDESRVGGFDVHSESGTSTAEEINLHHDEVAYNRSYKNAMDLSDIVTNYMGGIDMNETSESRQRNNDVSEAQKCQFASKAQVKNRLTEVDEVCIRKQQSLAEQAAAAALLRQEAFKVIESKDAANHSDSDDQSDGSDKTITMEKPSHTRADFLYREEFVSTSSFVDRLLRKGHIIGTIQNTDIIVPIMEAVEGFSNDPRIRKFMVGGPQPSTDDDKTILLFGPVGSGKSSTINSMLNYLYDVKKENNFRLVVDYPPKKTAGLTVYVVNNTIFPFKINIVDTPGVVEERGNKTVSTLIRKWFERVLRDVGTLRLDAISLVLPATITLPSSVLFGTYFRLDAISLVLPSDYNSVGWPFIDELAALKHMLGGDLKTNVLPIITNAEVLPQPMAIRALTKANISFLEYYKVNNLGFVPNVTGIAKLKHNLFFSHGIASFEAYFRSLQESVHPLLAVLRNGKHSASEQSSMY
ncbi:hypothetical protein DICVIV_10186 [Dictyocaulus viviparus]|uniref:G domain-containing protein n=1 Tax=Dictyocaulus viviparus TaxID=29172 RepID=A0A0D8XJ41_DICVI|nr:hypothetical protein DICVIV_10186 [Dictyocaulus viviparus]